MRLLKSYRPSMEMVVIYVIGFMEDHADALLLVLEKGQVAEAITLVVKMSTPILSW